MIRDGHGRRVTGSGWISRVAFVAVVVVTSALGVSVAYADTPGGAITGGRNGSDPELIQCPTPSGVTTLCLYTSEDLTSIPWPMGQNPYPMQRTLMYRLTPGTDASDPANWVYQGAAASETQLNALGIGVTVNTLHFWAPGVSRFNNAYYLYVPDVHNKNDESHASRIYLFKSTNVDGVHGFTYQGRVQTPASPNLGYASDPALYTGFGATTDPWLVYANGDNSNCGGISIGQVQRGNLLNFVNPPVVLDIGNIQNAGLGTCDGSHPYLEGPAVYSWDQVGAPISVPWNFFLEFAVKPNGVNAPGCDSQYEAIAYATANTINGPYTYGGILMCGSDTEWTNQASIVRHVSNSKILFAWHDGPQAVPQSDGGPGVGHARKTHLMCLTWNGNTPNRIPRSTSNMSNC